MSLQTLIITKRIKEPCGEETISAFFWIRNLPEAKTAVKFMNNELICEECDKRINSSKSRLSQIIANRNLYRQCPGRVE